MTYQEALTYIHSAGWHKGRPGLPRVSALLKMLGNPQDSCRYIHVAGTNGKGSVCAMLDSVLRAAGYRVGLFTSPYVRRFNERIAVDGVNISDEELAALTGTVKACADRMEEMPTEFELITAIGFLYFKKRKVDLVVLEVGLGGRLDPTNIIHNPLLSIITGIDFDHTEQLGNTIQAIAAEKAGIIKENCPCLYGGTDSSACRTICTVASLRHSPFYTVDRSLMKVKEMSFDRTVMDFDGYRDLELHLMGVYQPRNACTVLTAIQILREQGIRISEQNIRDGLKNASWMARFELLHRENPTVVFDGGHNPQGVTAAIKSIQTYFPEQEVNLLSGIMADKDYDGMIELMKGVVGRLYAVAPPNPRALSAEEYAEHARMHKIDAEACADVESALAKAIKESRECGRPLVCLGSLYLYRPLVEAVEAFDFES